MSKLLTLGVSGNLDFGAVATCDACSGSMCDNHLRSSALVEADVEEAGHLETIAHFRDGLREAFYAYDYDANGNRTSQIEDLGAGEVETTYDYDDADRLIETERAGRITTYVLDAVGNRAEEIITEGALTTEKTFDYNLRDQLERTWVDGSLEAEYAYDANGNRIEATQGGVTREFHFGARDRLLSLNVQGSPPEVEWTTTMRVFGSPRPRPPRRGDSAGTARRWLSRPTSSATC